MQFTEIQMWLEKKNKKYTSLYKNPIYIDMLKHELLKYNYYYADILNLVIN